MTLSKTATTILGSLAALAMLPAMAGSATDFEKKTLDIEIADYDLSNPEDAKIVYAKIQQGAKRVCRFTQSRQTLQQRAEEMQCRASAIANAVTQLDSPQLNLVMQGRDQSS